MHFDICCCTYNSEKWFEEFFRAMCAVNYDKKCLHLYFTDNCSTDHTVAVLQNYQQSLSGIFGDFEIMEFAENSGFGKASNHSAYTGKSDYVFFYNVDTAIHPDAFCELEQAILNADKKTAAFELRQFPLEHPKYYDPVTLKTEWASGAAMVLTRELFELTGGFDESIFMYCEDVDLSWRIRLAGYDIQYVPSAVTQHFTMLETSKIKTSQIAGELAGDKILRLKFGTKQDIKDWYFCEKRFEPHLSADPKAQELAKKLLAQVEQNKASYRNFYKTKVKNSGFIPHFEVGYTYFRLGEDYQNQLPQNNLTFSLIIRTYQRPNVLKITLQSLLNQTYKNFKVIVVEDGENPVSESVVLSFAEKLNIRYIAVKKNAGRCEVGNIGLAHVDTQYACFLDDDDYLFADFFEVNARLIETNPQCKLFCSSSVGAKTKYLNQDGSQFEFVEKNYLSAKNLRRINFYATNPVAIQSVVFDISLFLEYGGFDLELDAFEDWDLWVRYTTHCEIASTEKTLSLFKVPADKQQEQKRINTMDKYRTKAYTKLAKYSSTFDAQEIYGLFWTPEMAVNDFEQMQQSASEIQSSKIWKIAKSMRLVCGVLHTMTTAMFEFTENIMKFFGPDAPEEGCQEYKTLQKFVMDTQDCGFMQFFHRMMNKHSK